MFAWCNCHCWLQPALQQTWVFRIIAVCGEAQCMAGWQRQQPSLACMSICSFKTNLFARPRVRPPTHPSVPPPFRIHTGPDQVDALYHFAKWNFECGNYSAAAEYLYHYRTLSTHPERTISSLWGKVAADVLLQVRSSPRSILHSSQFVASLCGCAGLGWSVWVKRRPGAAASVGILLCSARAGKGGRRWLRLQGPQPTISIC
jgi:hypothetical protein